MRVAQRCILIVNTLWLVCAAPAALAHSLELTRTLLILRADGTYQVDMTCDLDALALGAAPTADSAELAAVLEALSPQELAGKVERLRGYFERRVRLRFDGQPAQPLISFPRHQAPWREERPGGEPPAAGEAAEPTVLGLTARLEGRLPEGASEVTFSASRAFPPVHLTLLDERHLGGFRQLLEPGAPSAPYPLDAAGSISVPEPVPLETAGRYLALGFWHIVPEGLDHILFVLGLFLLSARWRPLLWQVSAFTLAHTLTLALSTYGVIRLPPSVVEPLIALSIAYVAIENLLTSQLRPWRPIVVFAFGLLHGLGFAGVLGELGLPQEQRLTALLAFNAGVEVGQLAVLLGAFALVGWLRDRPWYRPRVVLPASIAIAAAGLFWALERTLGW